MIQKARIRTSWKNKGKAVSVVDFANALSAICWRIALNAAKNLHAQDFIYDSDSQRVGVIRGYLYFFIHCADRLTFDDLSQDQRAEFVTALSMDCRRHYVQNVRELFSGGADGDRLGAEFIAQLNLAMGDLASTKFGGGEPGFDMYRWLGAEIQGVMGLSQANKWVLGQVMDIDGPEAYELLRQSFDKLKRSAHIG